MPNFKLLALAAAAAASLLPGIAAAQFVIDFNLVPNGAAACTTTGVTGNSTGTVTFALPDPPNNAYLGTSVNGGAPSVLLQSLPGPFPQVEPAALYSIPLATATALPYTVTATAFAARNGLPVGIGSSLTVVCDVNGVGVATVARGLSAPLAQPVPVLPLQGLAGLASLLALAGCWRLAATRARREQALRRDDQRTRCDA